jgi:DNA-binding transcriptional LysR family regulator
VADQFFKESGLPAPENIVESLSLLTNVNLLVDSSFLGLMPTAAARRFIAAGLLFQLPLGDVGPSTEVGFSIREDKPLTPASRQLIECLKLAVQEDNALPGYNQTA